MSRSFSRASRRFGEVVAVDGIEPAEHHRLGVLVALEGLSGGPHRVGYGLATPRLADVLDAGYEVADLARAERGYRHADRGPYADLLDVVGSAGLHEPEPRPRREGPVDDPDGADHSPILVVVRVENEAL